MKVGISWNNEVNSAADMEELETRSIIINTIKQW